MRQGWSLNGNWKFQIDSRDLGERSLWYLNGCPEGFEVEVPHIWQIENNELLNYNGAAWYTRTFRIEGANEGRRFFIHFDAVDYHSKVWINGKYIGEHEGGFTPFEFDVTSFINLNEDNLVAVRVYDPQDNSEIPIGKQGSWYTRVSGIWQKVYIEERSPIFIEKVWVTPDIDKEEIAVKVRLNEKLSEGESIKYSIKNHLGEDNYVISGTIQAQGLINKFNVKIEDMILWDTSNPHLYEINMEVENEGMKDSYTDTFGMRKVEHKDGMVTLNGKPVYIRGALDQAFYPDTVYSAPSDEYIQKEINLAKKMGFNLLRKHIKIEIPRYLYWADRMGMLLWAEAPNYVKWTHQSRSRFRDTFTEMVERDYNHPAIIIWSIYNEEWGLEWDLANDPEKQEYVKEFYNYSKELDATRLICDNSGWAHIKTDINDHHRYFVCPDQLGAWEKDLDEFVIGDPDRNFVKGYKSEGEPIIVSEFGVWGLPSVDKIKEHYGKTPWWFVNQAGEEHHQEDFKKPPTAELNFSRVGLDKIYNSFEELAAASQKRMFRAVKSVIEEMRKRPQVAGYVVTEFTDIEWETNGWVDYMRNPKEGFERLKDFNGSVAVMVDKVNHNLWTGEEQAWNVIIRNDDLKAIKGTIKWSIENTDIYGEIGVELKGEAYICLDKAIKFKAPKVEKSGFYNFEMELSSSTELIAENQEELTISTREKVKGIKINPYRMSDEFTDKLIMQGYSVTNVLDKDTLIVTSFLDQRILELLQGGGRVVFLAEQGDDLLYKGQYTFRHLPEGESWPRASSFNYVNTKLFEGVPLLPEMGWEVDDIIPNCVVPIADYKKASGSRTVNMFGNTRLADSCEIISGYFQGWIGQNGVSTLRQGIGSGTITLTTWRLLQNYGVHPIATQILNQLIKMN